jgi:hypothetical protein
MIVIFLGGDDKFIRDKQPVRNWDNEIHYKLLVIFLLNKAKT